MKRIISTTLALILVFVTAPVSAQTTTCVAQHKVIAGDTLFKLGIKYKVAWSGILSANGIKDVMNLKIGSMLCIPASAVTPTATPKPTTSPAPSVTATAIPLPSLRTPIFSISSVVPGKSVTIRASGFPLNDNFDVTMGAMGTRGIGGTVVGRTNSGGGSFSATYTIPAAYAKSAQIAIRLQSPFTGFYSFNWLFNN